MRIAFGLEPFQFSAGMYMLSRVGMKVTMEERVSFAPIIGPEDQILAGLFAFRGFHFLLYLEPEGPQDLRGLFFRGEHLAASTLLFQTMTLNIEIGAYLSHSLKVIR